MSSLAVKAKQIARRWLDEDPGGLRTAEWSAEVIEMLSVAEDLGVDVDVTLAATWASATIGAGCWLEPGPGYDVDDVRQELGEQVARIVSWTVQPEWQLMDEYLTEVMEDGPVEARLILLARTMVETVSGNARLELLAGRAMRLAMSIPALSARAVAASWPTANPEGEA